MRRRARFGSLPDGLSVFVPTRWLEPDEDERDPIAVHAHAYGRWLDACSEALRVPLYDLPECGGWWGPVPGRAGCPCSVCSPGRGRPGSALRRP